MTSRRRRAAEPPSLDSLTLPEVLAALGDPVRLEVIRQLAMAGGVVHGPFEVGVTMSTLSHHLSVLQQNGLVTLAQEGRTRRCELRRAGLEERFPGLLEAVLTSL